MITTPLTILDRTNEKRPLVISDHSPSFSNTILIDNNLSRPAVIVLHGASLNLAAAYRRPNGVNDVPTDPGLGDTFDGTFLPKLEIGFSHHDFARAFIVGMGKARIICREMIADTCVLLTAQPSGSYGVGSLVDLEKISGYRFGVLATGQEGLEVNVGRGLQSLWGNEEGPGHTFYANESRLSKTNEFLRVIGCKVIIGWNTAVAMVPKVRKDHVTAKFKGTWGVDYQCAFDRNPCGAFDQYGASGIAKVNWAHDGSDAQNNIFTAFRCGGDGGFGTPRGKFVVAGSMNAALAPDQKLVPAFRWETKYAAASEAEVIGGAPPSIYDGTDTLGLIVTPAKVPDTGLPGAKF